MSEMGIFHMVFHMQWDCAINSKLQKTNFICSIENLDCLAVDEIVVNLNL